MINCLDQGPSFISRDPQLEVLECAIKCQDIGWSLVPMEGKHPMFHLLPDGKWESLKQCPATEDVIRSWFACSNKVGIAVIHGSSSNGIMCLDIDKPELFHDEHHLVPTVTIETPRGHRYYYRTDEPIKKTKAPWGDVLGEGSLSVLAPSLWSDMLTRYKWPPGREPWNCEVAPLPAFFSYLVEPVDQRIWTPVSEFISSEADFIGRDILNHFMHEPSVRRMMPTLGVPHHRIDSAFKCILPGHQESCPSACIVRGENGTYIYFDHHEREKGRKVFLLPEVFLARQKNCSVKIANKSELATWGLRLLYESKLLEPVPIDLGLPDDAPDYAKTVADGFELLVGLKWKYEYGPPTAFSREFVKDWCRIGEYPAKEGIKYLVDGGFIVQVGVHGGRTRLFMPTNYMEGPCMM